MSAVCRLFDSVAPRASSMSSDATLNAASPCHLVRRMGASLIMVICDGPLFRSSRRPCGVSRRWLRWCVQVRLLARCTAARSCDHVITGSVSSFGETASDLVRLVPLRVSEPGIASYTVITVDLDGRRKALRFLGVLRRKVPYGKTLARQCFPGPELAAVARKIREFPFVSWTSDQAYNSRDAPHSAPPPDLAGVQSPRR